MNRNPCAWLIPDAATLLEHLELVTGGHPVRGPIPHETVYCPSSVRVYLTYHRLDLYTQYNRLVLAAEGQVVAVSKAPNDVVPEQGDYVVVPDWGRDQSGGTVYHIYSPPPPI